MTKLVITKIWTDVLKVVVRQVPGEIREQVLSNLLEKARQRKPLSLNVSKLEDWDAEDEQNFRIEREAAALLVQVLTRSITNNFSKEEAAKILFRDHHRNHYGRGTGSGWLPDYLDGLPGITVDKTKCIEIANSCGPSKLKDMVNG